MYVFAEFFKFKDEEEHLKFAGLFISLKKIGDPFITFNITPPRIPNETKFFSQKLLLLVYHLKTKKRNYNLHYIIYIIYIPNHRILLAYYVHIFRYKNS